MGLEQYIRAIHDYERKRGDLRARLVTEDLGEGERGSVDAEIFSLNAEIQRHARLINVALEDMAKRRIAPDRPLSVGDVGDPDLKAFLDQVKSAVERLRRAKEGEGGPIGEARDKVGRERERAHKLKDDSLRTRKEIEAEQKKSAQARQDIARERSRIEKERKRLEEERAHIERDKTKLENDRETLETRLEKDKKDRETADRERKDVARKLKSFRGDPKTRVRLEQRGQELTQKISFLDRRRTADQRVRDDRVDRMLKSIKRELDQLDEADERFKKELAHLDSEGKRLDERDEQIAEALATTDERLETIESAEAQLKG